MVLTLEYLIEVSQAVFALALAPLVVGFVRWLKARLQNRRGAPPWQPYFELRKLFGKEVVMSNNASWLFRFVPYIVFASTLAVTFLVPFFFVPVPFDGVGDLLVVVYLLLLGTFFLALAGLDPGTAFGGMGSSREMTVAAIAEPTIAAGHLQPGARGRFDQPGTHRHADAGAIPPRRSALATCWLLLRCSSWRWLKPAACRWTIRPRTWN